MAVEFYYYRYHSKYFYCRSHINWDKVASRAKRKTLMDTVPEHLDYNTIKESILKLEHIEQVHDLHIWSISQNKPSLSAHLKLCSECTETHHWSECLKNTQSFLAKEYGIKHCTLQIEPMDFIEENHCG